MDDEFKELGGLYFGDEDEDDVDMNDDDINTDTVKCVLSLTSTTNLNRDG